LRSLQCDSFRPASGINPPAPILEQWQCLHAALFFDAGSILVIGLPASRPTGRFAGMGGRAILSALGGCPGFASGGSGRSRCHSAFPSRFTGLFWGELVCLSLLMRSATALAGNVPLTLRIHCRETPGRFCGLAFAPGARGFFLPLAFVLRFLWH
jgi:hypothetical protein